MQARTSEAGMSTQQGDPTAGGVHFFSSDMVHNVKLVSNIRLSRKYILFEGMWMTGALGQVRVPLLNTLQYHVLCSISMRYPSIAVLRTDLILSRPESFSLLPPWLCSSVLIHTCSRQHGIGNSGGRHKENQSAYLQ